MVSLITPKKREGTNYIRNEKKEHKFSATDTEKITSDYCKSLYTNVVETADEVKNSKKN